MTILRNIAYLVLLFLVGCASQPKPQQITETRPLATFNGINNLTGLDIKIVTQQAKASMVVQGDIADVRRVSSQVENNVLTLRQKGNKRVRVTVNLPGTLQTLNHHGQGRIYGNHLRTQALVLNTTKGDLNLQGNLNIINITQHGDGNIRLAGVNSPNNFTLNSHGEGKIYLKGPHVGLAQLNHYGNGDIHITGVASDSLVIHNSGNGLINLEGRVGIENAKGIKHRNLIIKALGHGQINLKGEFVLDRIVYNGNDNLNIKGIRNHRLEVNSHGKGHVMLAGELGVYQVNHSGSGKLILRGVQSKGLQVNSSGSGEIRLTGTMNLQTLTQNGSGQVYINRIASHNISIRGHGDGHIELHGHADNLHAVLSGHIDLNASQIKVQHAYINTSEYAVAKVYPEKVLNALATRQSNIYYYHHPSYIADYSRHNASVIFAGGTDFCSGKQCATAHYAIG